MLKEPSNVSIELNEEKFAHVIEEVNEWGYDDCSVKDGICHLVACSSTVFGIAVSDVYNSLTDVSFIERLERYLMALEVPPTQVIFMKNKISLYWYPRGKVSVNTNDEYLGLLRQFQAYIDLMSSADLLDLQINIYALDVPTEVAYGADVESLPLVFSHDVFALNDGEKIEFVNDTHIG